MIRRWRWGAGALLAALTANAGWHAGLFPLMIMGATLAVWVLSVAVQFLVSGASVAHHALQTERAIQAVEANRQRREITR